MKIVILFVLFSFFSLVSLFGQNSYVAEMKKNNVSVSSGNNPGYVDSHKKRENKSNDPILENSFVQKHSISISGPSYVQQMKQVKPKDLVIKSAGVMASLQVGVDQFIPTEPKKVSQFIIISQPIQKIKKIWKKVFPSRQSDDLSFDPADFQDIAAWAKKEGKTHQAKEVAEKYGLIISTLAVEFGVDSRIIIAICAHESGGNPNVISYAGAKGLMQLMPGTAASYGVYGIDIFDPYKNLRAGTAYYADMVKLFGNTKDAIYAYGCGHSKARRRFNQGVRSEDVVGVQQVLYLAQTQ